MMKWRRSSTRLGDDELRAKILAYSMPAPDGSGCRLWMRGTFGYGYGHIATGGGSRAPAHKLSLELKLGRPLIDGMEACHTCHKPACVSDEHLYEGTSLQNKADAVAANRTAFGERSATAKLTSQDVIAIRQTQGTISDIARSYGMDRKTIRQIRRREIWVRVP